MCVSQPEAISVRIIRLPSVRMARSGQSDLGAFDTWWSSVAAQDRSSLFPRDFMWFNQEFGCFEWLYALPAGVTDTGGYEVLDFPGGLYAVATCRDEGEEITSTNRRIHEWVAQSECFEECPCGAGGVARYDMGHVITPPSVKERLGYGQMDLFVPIGYRDGSGG